MIDKETGVYVSEDFAFCQRWRDIGGKIWLDTEGKLIHTGAYNFSGDPRARYAPEVSAGRSECQGAAGNLLPDHNPREWTQQV